MLPTVFLDVDSTLIVPKQSISNENIEAIRKYVSLGGHIHLVTGKLTSSLIDLVKVLNIEHDIHGGANGGMILENNEETCIHTLGLVSKDIVAYLKKHGIPYYIYYQDYIGYAHSNPNLDELDKMAKLKDPEPRFETNHRYEDVIKILLFLDEHTDTETQLVEAFKDNSNINLMRTSHDLFEFHHPMMLKSVAVSYILSKQPATLTIAIGDSENDRSMLELVDYAFVVANANESLKALYPILPSCQDHGVAYLLHALMKQTSIDSIIVKLKKGQS